MRNILAALATIFTMVLPLQVLQSCLPDNTSGPDSSDTPSDTVMQTTSIMAERPGPCDISPITMFDKAVDLIKKYETLHQPRHWPLVGYGHKVLPGEKFSRSRRLSEKEADTLLRKDLRKLCSIYREYGRDSLLLAALAYNCGTGTVSRSSVLSKLRSGNRDIEQSYVSHSRYRGKSLPSLRKRRQEELATLFMK